MKYLPVALLVFLFLSLPLSAQLTVPYFESGPLPADPDSFFGVMNASGAPLILVETYYESFGSPVQTISRPICSGCQLNRSIRSLLLQDDVGALVLCSNADGALTAPAGSLDPLFDGPLAKGYVTVHLETPTADNCLLPGPPLPDDDIFGEWQIVDEAGNFSQGRQMVRELHAGEWSVRFNRGDGGTVFDGSRILFHGPAGGMVGVRAVNEAGAVQTLFGQFGSGVAVTLRAASATDIGALQPGSPFGRIIVTCPDECWVGSDWNARGRFSAPFDGHYLGMPFVAMP